MNPYAGMLAQQLIWSKSCPALAKIILVVGLVRCIMFKFSRQLADLGEEVEQTDNFRNQTRLTTANY